MYVPNKQKLKSSLFESQGESDRKLIFVTDTLITLFDSSTNINCIVIKIYKNYDLCGSSEALWTKQMCKYFTSCLFLRFTHEVFYSSSWSKYGSAGLWQLSLHTTCREQVCSNLEIIQINLGQVSKLSSNPYAQTLILGLE